MRRPRLVGVLGLLFAFSMLQACDPSVTGSDPETFTLTVAVEGLGLGSVTSAPTGIDCDTEGGTCAADFEDGTEVTLTATPDAGSVFVEWSGDGSGSAPVAITMSADRSVTAEFDNPDLAVETMGTAGGAVESRDGGVTLFFPADALSGDEDITIERLDAEELGAEWADLVGDGAIGAAYEFGPDGLEFDEPVEVRLPEGEAATAGDTAVVEVPGVWTVDGGAVTDVAGVDVATDWDTGSYAVTGYLEHFSPFARSPGGTPVIWTGMPTMALPVRTAFTISVKPGSPEPDELTTTPGGEYVSSRTGAAVELLSEGWMSDPLGYDFNWECTRRGTSTMVMRTTFIASTMSSGADRVAIMTTSVQCTGVTLTASTSGAGSGEVVAAGPADGIECGNGVLNCAEDYATGEVVPVTASPSEGSVFVKWKVDGVDMGTNNPIDILMDDDRTVDAEFGIVPLEPALFLDLSDLSITGLEGLSALPGGFPIPELAPDLAPDGPAGYSLAADVVCTPILVSGTGGTLMVDPCTGQHLGTYAFEPTYYVQPRAFLKPEGAPASPDAVNTIYMAGQRYGRYDIRDDGTIESFIALAVGFNYTDSGYRGGDPANGGFLVNEKGAIAPIDYDETFGLHLVGLPSDTLLTAPGAVTAAVNATGDKWISIGTRDDGGLETVLWYTDTTLVSDQAVEVDTLDGTNPRILRCDFESGLCAVSDYAGSQITIIAWDGESAPELVDVTAPAEIGTGPVGIDIYGQMVLTAGYGDDTYTLIELDVDGTILSSTTSAVPSGCLNPGHAIFLRDASNTVVISCYGSTGIARVINAF